MFEFLMDDLPLRKLEVEKAEIVIYLSYPPYKNRAALNVDVSAKTIYAPSPEAPDDRSYDYRISPTFYTEWLDIDLSELSTRRLDALDGYHMFYDQAREEELGFDQFPGAVYQDSHAGFEKAEMHLDYLGKGHYRVRAEGETEFGWKFKINAVARLTKIASRHDIVGEDKSPHPDVVDFFERYFDPALFNASWERKGSSEEGWYVYEAFPKAELFE